MLKDVRKADSVTPPLKLVVYGTQGIGKTTFVRSQYPTLEVRFGGRLYTVDLRGYVPQTMSTDSAGETLLGALANAMDLQPNLDLPLFQHVQIALATAQACVVVDNFETLQAAAPTLAHLVDATPGLTVIVTSRSLLRLRHEAQLAMEGLPVKSEIHLRLRWSLREDQILK